MGIGDWGLGIGDWGLGPIPNPQSPFLLYKNANYILFKYILINLHLINFDILIKIKCNIFIIFIIKSVQI